MSLLPEAAELEALARTTLGTAFALQQVIPVGGGDISPALRLIGTQTSVFVKLAPAADAPMFAAEAENLRALAACTALKVPSVLGLGETAGHAALLLEWLDLEPLREDAAAQRAGAALAELHRCTQEHYGWPHANFIGRTPQHNAQSSNWPRFFIEQRLLPQFELAAANGFRKALMAYAEPICAKLPALFLEYRPQASLLHGDLWSGNLGALADGTPVLFDPACYYGDRETDVAMSELFGGLPLAFYAAYRAVWPLQDDYERRKPLYNLYHILNHLNLFGRSYLAPAERLAAQLARDLGH